MAFPPYNDAFYFLQIGENSLVLNPQENSIKSVSEAPGPPII